MSSGTSPPSSLLFELKVKIISAKLQFSRILFKPDPYVELIMDGRIPVKTEYQKSTITPKWEEQFAVLASPYSRLNFRICNHGSLVRNGMLGECAFDLHSILVTRGGRLNCVTVTLDLQTVGKTSRGAGTLLVMLDDVQVDMNYYPARDFPVTASSNIRSVTIPRPQSTFTRTNDASSSTPATRSVTPNNVLDANSSPFLSPVQFDANPDISAINTVPSCGINSTLQSGSSREHITRPNSAAAGQGLSHTTDTSNQGEELVGRHPKPFSSVLAQDLTSSPSCVTDNANQSGTSPSSLQRPTMQSVSSSEEGPLPQGWEVRCTPKGHKYYVDHNTRSTTWERPQSLPSSWEIRRDNRGRVYYADHNTRTTTWQRPTAETVRNYEHWQSNQAQVMQQCYQRYLFPTSAQAENQDPLGTLPEGWEKQLDLNGRVYFVNHKNKTTQWEDPRTQGLEEPLPPGWEVKFSPDGKKYFFNHNTNTITFQDPRTSSDTGEETTTGPVTYKRNFKWKLTKFRYLCHCNAVPGQVKILVSRTHIFEESYSQVMKVPPYELRRRLFITFKGEEGLDYGGVAREWFFTLSHEVLNPMYCLFEYAEKGNYSVQINPASSVNPDHISYFQFIGRFIAMALFHGKFIYSGFTLPFYKCMLGKQLTMKDIESIDDEYYNSLVWIKENNIDELEMEMYFSVNFEVLGEVISHDLKPDGGEIKVTEDNKDEYLRLMTQWRFSRGQEEQIKAFLDGFNEVLPLEWLHYFDERELELILCGMQEINVDDWQKNTIYRKYTKNSKQVVWFWQFVKKMDNEKRSRLLQFVTGTCRVPVSGFGELIGSNGPQRFCIQKIGNHTWLPRSHTCFNRLDLPPYKNYEQLVEKLTYAVEETEGFAQE